MVLNHNDVTIYMNGIENRLYVTRERYISKRRSFMVVLYNLITLFFSKPKIDTESSIFIINGSSQRKMSETIEYGTKIYRGKCFEPLFTNFSCISFWSHLSFPKRIRLFFFSMSFYQKNKDELSDFGTWLEYCLLKSMLTENSKLKSILVRGHYDEITTWLSYLSLQNNIKLVIRQHGVVIPVEIPHKLNIYELLCFDKQSGIIFKNYFIANSECKITKCEFISNVKFDLIERKPGFLYIGLAEQGNPAWVSSIMETIKSAFDKVIFVIMLHPLYKSDYKGDDIVNEQTKKIANVDCVITDSSTLLLDFYSYKQSLKLAYTSEKMVNTFIDYPFSYLGENKAVIEFIEGCK